MPNNQLTDKNLASLAAIMLLAPAVQFMLKDKSIDVAAEEEAFVRGYIRYGYWILTVLGLALIVGWFYSFRFPLTVLYWINYGLLGIVILMIIMGVFAIINNKALIQQGTNMENTSAPAMNHDLWLISYFMPLYNYYMWYNDTLDNHNYRWVKESVLWRSLYIIAISIWPSASIIFLGLFLIAARMIMVIVGMDLLSLQAKNTLNTIFSHNIEELIAYPLGFLTNMLKKIFQKNSSLSTEISSRKATYAQLDPISHWRTVVQYLLALGAILYRGYVTWLSSNPTVGLNLALLPQILLLGKILMTIPSGKLPRIPILYSLLGGKKNSI